MKPNITAVDALRELQRVSQRSVSTDDGQPIQTRRLPQHLTDGKILMLGLLSEQVAALELARIALQNDPSFEYIQKVDEVVWEFFGKCWTAREFDHVPDFLNQHKRELEELTCFIPIENLVIRDEIGFLGIRLLPTDSSSIPTNSYIFKIEKPTGSVAAITVQGTNHVLMANRGRTEVEHVLRLMRVALREHPALHDRQLRFQAGSVYALGSEFEGRNSRAESAYELEFNEELVSFIQLQPLSELTRTAVFGIDKKANLALSWIEEASLAVNPLVSLLLLFFALEAMLGRKDETRKAHALAFRQTMLSHLVEGTFSHPNTTVFLYEDVRSTAVHGEGDIKVDWDEVRGFARSVRNTLNQFLKLAKEQNIKKRSRLLKYLDEHPDRSKLKDWLLGTDKITWEQWLSELG